ncbi:tripartite tricarboxylate transporter TctB family protein [Blastococcus sp. VKM Ac-2987]|uniref:tripartite tricarboxylate transporter TctB family protein n=1 Tax=Blastococcus sp. VKM Ac-2987 TaxID=3004141 RepID=UPI0022AB7562|nr:tripartite tricarboxylate transporter TctB family protein [Blastococcus sp. VKM Ac-2987]MCZ2861216.1 tripartite tricarboxylate transporter TctB family protein [Blastococcus sp. VKM Ac-2987]
MKLHDARKDLLAGAIFTGFGLAFAITSASYDIGTPLRMGPGFFPLVLGGLLVVLGIAIAVTGFIAGEGSDPGPVPWRALVLLVAALLFFGYFVRALGLVPTLLVTVTMAGLAGRSVRVVPAVVIAVSITALSVLIFVVALQLRLPLLGPWLGG